MVNEETNFKFPDSGQITAYDENGKLITPSTESNLYGQDGCYHFNKQSFSKLNQDGDEISESANWRSNLRMVRDNNTGLIWEVKSPDEDDVNFMEDNYSWEEASSIYTAKLNKSRYGGYSDWRIPNKDELRSILNYENTSPAVDKWYFPNCQSDLYWCNSTYEMQPYFGWVIFFGLGSATANGKSMKRKVRAVRGGYSDKFGKPDLSRFVDNNDGTITDLVTNLMWQKGENPRMNWYEALKTAKKMDLAGYNDWRLPNIKELNSILDVSYKDNWWYFKDFFPADGLEPPLLHYFSSTVYEKTYAWVTNFCFGYDGYYASKYAPLLFRAVRSIKSAVKQDEVFAFPDTGQDISYNDVGEEISLPSKSESFYGQDSNYSINPMSFSKARKFNETIPDNTNWRTGFRMVKDNNTGLVWETKSPDKTDLNYFFKKYTFAEAMDFVKEMNSMNYGGFNDWRLPNREELRSIVNYNDVTPAIDKKYFPDIVSDFYWSKDVYQADPKMIWGVYFTYGCSICYLNENSFYCKLVRGGYNNKFGDVTQYDFSDNNDGTITDNNTGLMWKKEESPLMSFIDALKYCEELNLAGYDDWRLPNMKELPTLLDLTFSDKKWYFHEFFPNVITKPLGFYWCSTTFSGTFGWGVNFQFGYDGYYAGKKHGKYAFRPVRTIK